jgi:HSP20 family protein
LKKLSHKDTTRKKTPLQGKDDEKVRGGKDEIAIDSRGVSDRVFIEIRTGNREETMSIDDFDQMRNRIHRLMGEFFKEVKPLSYQPKRSFHPPMDIYETGDSLVIVMEIAGVRGDDIQVLFEKSLLSISGTRTEFSPSSKTQLHQMEIDYGYFERTLHVPFSLNVDEIKATYREGFLMVTVPKKKESVSKAVEVKIL